MKESICRMIRILTPFICSVLSLVEGVSYFMGKEESYILSSIGGYSIAVVLYFFVNSRRMCIWYKLNLCCLLLIQIMGIVYYFIPFDMMAYLYIFTLISSIGVGTFLIYITISVKGSLLYFITPLKH